MEENTIGYEVVKYDRWKKVIFIAQIVLSFLIFVTEVIGNIMLYVTKSQGYGPDTIVQKLLRYLVLTTCINLVAMIVGQIIVRLNDNVTVQKYVLIIVTIIICTNIAFSHYQFTVIFACFSLPLILTILYEDRILCNWTFGMSLAGATSGILARAFDREYNKDIGPEAAIAIAIIIGVFIFSKICIRTLEKRRVELNKALVIAEKSKYHAKVEQMSLQMLNALANTIDAKDKYTNGHSFRVAEYSVKIATEIGMGSEEIKNLRQEALLHDIGKIGVPDLILNKPGKLTDLEFEVMKSHTTVGADILKNMIFIPNAASVARGHHERYDGKGYPEGLVGEEIPAHARIVCIADAYDAMSSDRIYRNALPKEKIREQLVSCRGTQFDPVYLDAFLKLFDEDELEIKDNSNDIVEEMVSLEKIRDELTRFINENDSIKKGAMKVEYNNFVKLYEFTNQMKKRYNRNFELVVISTKPNDKCKIDDKEIEDSSVAMEMAIKKNIRMVDIYTKYNPMQHVIILAGTDKNNVNTIIQRVFLDYYRFNDSGKFVPIYEVEGDND